MLQKKNITKEVRNKIPSNTIMSSGETKERKKHEEYDLNGMADELIVRGLAQNSIDTYIRNFTSFGRIKRDDGTITGFSKGLMEQIENSPQEAALDIARRLFTKGGFSTAWRSKAFTSTSVKKAKIASLLVAIDANKEGKVYAANNLNDRKMIDRLRAEAVIEQKAYHKEVQSKNAKESANWVDWTKIVGRAKETIKEYNDYVEKKGMKKITAAAYASKYNIVQKETAAADKVALKEALKKQKKENKGKTYSSAELKAEMKAGRLSRNANSFWTPYLKIVNKPFTTKIVNALVAALYTEMPPRRLDYAGGKLIVVTQEEMDSLCEDQEPASVKYEGGKLVSANDEKVEGNPKNYQTEKDCDPQQGTDDEFKPTADDANDPVYSHIWYVIPSKHNPFSIKSHIVFGRFAGKSPQDSELRVDNLASGLRTLVGTYYSLLLAKDPEYNLRPLLVNAMDLDEDGDYRAMTENGLGKRIKKIFSGKYGNDGKCF